MVLQYAKVPATLCNMQVTPAFSKQLLSCAACLLQPAGSCALHLSYEQQQMLLLPFC